ncbi:ribonuclease P protein component [Weeksella virosa]|uniref:Ribonuclease P protein component n=2 Tax=Weeksella virosa TaxID=1014 RepID=F0P228_WEEVC|nr:ribonuclease P protein component [Weeksella virosa]ADX67738.1 Ribonuclease P protein component [Weeksella virosa DSM 16922]MDK7674284.1 ribonuclease P protein component [Weeksella virosa]SUP54037.1 ribonuclease P [Weeksella virosa]VEH64635.1 ribonuclease P [Weeksella virosa]
MSATFGKDEKLKSRKAIERLFTDSRSYSVYPLRIVYRVSEQEKNQFAVSVSKKRFKLAVDRNKMKRRIREAYRLNKTLLDNSPLRYEMMVIYLSKDKNSFLEIEKAMQVILKKLVSVSNAH